MTDPLLGLSEEHEALRQRVRALAEEHIAPILVETDSHERWPREVFQAFGAEGLLGGTLPEAYGGAGMDNVTLTVMCEELGRYSQPIAGLIGGVSTVFGTGLMQYGTEEQRQRYLVPYARGETTGALALTEARSGSDAAGMQTTARRVEDGWVLDGQKAWIDSAGTADWFIVFAQGDATKGTRGINAYIVERGTPGFTTSEYKNKQGWRPSSVGELNFERLPAARRRARRRDRARLPRRARLRGLRAPPGRRPSLRRHPRLPGRVGGMGSTSASSTAVRSRSSSSSRPRSSTWRSRWTPAVTSPTASRGCSTRG